MKIVDFIEGEIWKGIPGYPNYYASNIGRIKKVNPRSLKENLLKPKPDKDGYLKVNPYLNKKNTNAMVHRLVAFTFIPLVEGKNSINHINGIKSDNAALNLEWVNNSENSTYWAKNNPKFSSKFTGVSWNTSNMSWAAAIFDSKAKKTIHLGYFDNEIDASKAYQKAHSKIGSINKYIAVPA